MSKFSIYSIILLAFLLCFAGESHAQTNIQSGPNNPTFCTPGSFFYNTTSATYQQCGPVNTWTASVGVASVSSLPATCTPGVTPPVQLSVAPAGLYTCVATNIWALVAANSVSTNGGDIFLANPKYGAKMNVQFAYGNVCTVTVTNGSPSTVTNSCGFVNPVIGMPIYATNGCCGTSNNITGTLLTAAAGATISGLNSSTSLNITGATTPCSGATCIIVYGNIDDTAISAAETDWQASPKCSAFVLPGAFVGFQNPHWNNPGTQCNGAEPAIDFTATVKGEGQGVSGIVPFPPFNFAGCTFGPGSNGCLFGYQEAVVEDFVIYGAGWGNTGANSKVLMNFTTGTLTSHISAVGFGASDSNLICMAITNFNQGYNLILDGCGKVALTVNSGEMICYYCNFQDVSGKLVSIQTATMLDYGGTYGGSTGTAWISFDNSTATFKGWGTSEFGNIATNNTTFFFLSNNANATLFCDGCSVNMTKTGSIGIFSNASTQSITLFGSTIGGTGGNQVLVGTSILKDLGGNSFPGLFPAATLAPGAYIPYRAVTGACTGVGTAASTLGLRVSGSSTTGTAVVTACTNSAVIDAGQIMDHAGTLQILQVTVSAAGTNASSGVVTVLKNGGATTLTCTVGTGTSCFDGTHTASFVAGDLISYNVTTQAADTLAGVKASVSAY